jgi:hypothetical protein
VSNNIKVKGSYMSEINSLEEVQRRLNIFKKPLDIEKYIEKGVIARHKKTKSKFVVLCNPKELPEEINIRTTALESTSSETGSGRIIITLDLKVAK